jgi:hypothetical protein
MMKQLKTAAYREHCDWGWRMQDLNGAEAIAFLLPEIQETRDIARRLSLRARLEIGKGNYDQARESLLLGYRLGHDVSRPPILINDLVGIAIASVMNEQLLAFIEAPDSPNMYWALTELSQSYIDMQDSLRFEMTLWARMFPFLKDVESKKLTPEEWRVRLVESLRKLGSVSDLTGADGTIMSFSESNPWAADVGAAALATVFYPRAKRSLLAGGYSREEVEQMPVAKVIALQQYRACQYASQEMFKWSLLPPAEAGSRLTESKKVMDDVRFSIEPRPWQEPLPIVSLLLPAVNAAKQAEVRLNTQFAGLRTVEAIRMHAAVNDGQLPKTLDQIKVVPLPLNPSTGKPFNYRLRHDTGILEVPNERTPSAGWRIEMTIRK